jgi:hypothetical protein
MLSVPSREHVAPADRPPGPVNQGRDHGRQRAPIGNCGATGIMQPRQPLPWPPRLRFDTPAWQKLLPSFARSVAAIMPPPSSRIGQSACQMLSGLFRNCLRGLGPYSLARPKHDNKKRVGIKDLCGVSAGLPRFVCGLKSELR